MPSIASSLPRTPPWPLQASLPDLTRAGFLGCMERPEPAQIRRAAAVLIISGRCTTRRCQTGSAIPSASRRSPLAPCCRRAGTQRRHLGVPCARLGAPLLGFSAGCLPASPYAPRSARAAGPAVQLQEVEGVEESLRLVPPMAQKLGGQPTLVTAHHLAVDQARPHLEVVHGLDHERVALRPVMASSSDQSDAHGWR